MPERKHFFFQEGFPKEGALIYPLCFVGNSHNIAKPPSPNTAWQIPKTCNRIPSQTINNDHQSPQGQYIAMMIMRQMWKCCSLQLHHWQWQWWRLQHFHICLMIIIGIICSKLLMVESCKRRELIDPGAREPGEGKKRNCRGFLQRACWERWDFCI